MKPIITAKRALLITLMGHLSWEYAVVDLLFVGGALIYIVFNVIAHTIFALSHPSIPLSCGYLEIN